MTDDTLHTLHTADITQHNPYLLPLPLLSPLHMATASPQFYPLPARHVHTLLSSCSTEALARYVNKVNRIVAGGMQQNLYNVLS